MKRFKKITSAIVSLITAFSIVTSSLPTMIVNAANLSRDDLGWNQNTYNYMSTITNGITSLGTTAGINTSGNGSNQTGLKNNLNEIQKAGYTFNFNGRVKPSDQYILVYDGSGNEKARCSLDGNIYGLNSIIASLSGENFNHIIDYDNNRDKYYGSDESARDITAISMDGSSNNAVYKNKTGFSIYDSRSYIGIAHNDTGKDYFIKLPDKNKCKIAMLYKNGGSYIDTTTGLAKDVDVLLTCNNYDFSDEAVPYLSTGTSISDDDNDWAYFTKEMIQVLKDKGLTTSTKSKRTDSLIYRKLPQPIAKKYTVTHGDGVTTTTTYEYEYVIPTYLVSDAASKGVFAAVEKYLKTTYQGTEQPVANRKYYYPRRTQYTKRYVTNVDTACLRFTDDRPGIYGGAANWFDMNYKFYKAGTTTPVAVSGYSCWKDVDGQQGVSSAAFLDKITTGSGQQLMATGAWETASNTSVKRYNWTTSSGTALTGYFDYKITNSTPNDTSNWVFATFSKKSSINLIYSFWGSFSDTQKNRLGMLPSGWMMCDYPGIERDFYANYRVQKVVETDGGKAYRLDNSEYSALYNIGFVLIDENGKVCQLSKRTNADGEIIDRGNYSYVKTLSSNDLTKGTLLRTTDTGYIFFDNLPLGKYKLVEALTTKSFNGNQPIPAAKMIFSEPNAPGNHCSESFNGATVNVNNSNVTVTCQGTSITLVTTEINVSHILNFENDRQDYAANGTLTGIIANGVDGKSTPVNSRITNIASTQKFNLNVQKVVTLSDETKSNATSSNVPKLISGINFTITNSKGEYIEVSNGKYVGSSDNENYITLDDNGQIAISGLPFGKYVIEEFLSDKSLSSIWDIKTEQPLSFELSDETCTYENGSYTYSMEFDNPELYGGLTIKKITATGENISGIKFYLTGVSDSGRKISMSVVTDSNGYGKFEKVPVGTYNLSEDPDTVPDGWTVAQSRTVSIVSGQMAESNITEVENTPIQPKTGEIRITKVDSETSALLAGAEFSIYSDVNQNKSYDSSDTYVDTIIITGSGVGSNSNLPIGDYFVKETKAPDGYIIDDNYYFVTVSEGMTTTVKTNNNGFGNTPIKGNIKLTKVDGENTSTKLTGAVFRVFKDVDGNGQYQSAVDTFVDTLIDNGDGTYVIDNLPYGKYVVRESKAPTGYKLDVKNYPVNITENGMTYIVNNITGTELFGNEPIKGNIKLTKVDSENTSIKLSGAVFTVYDESGKSVGTMTENNGVYTMSSVRYGKYTVKETKAPTGYAIDTKAYSVNITENGMTYVISNITGTELFGNEPIKGNIKLTKVDSENTSAKLSGAIFTVFNDVDGNGQYQSAVDTFVDTLIDNGDGTYVIDNLPYGKYVVRESKAPKGYLRDVKNYAVNITENDMTYIVNNIAGTELFGNTPIKGNIELTKVDSENRSVELSGAVFTVYDESGKSVGTMTDTNGVYTMSNIRYGKYTVKETKAPTGYVADTNLYTVNITENGMTYIVNNIAGTELFGNKPIKGNIKLTKVDSEDTSTKLSGAVFRVFKDVDGNGQYQSTVDTSVGTMTENNGVYTMPNLKYGKYVVRESKAPTGYKLDVKNYSVNITENGMTYVISNIAGTELFGNKPIKGNIKLTKVDSENTSIKLSGAVFTVYDESGKTVGTMTENNGVYTMPNLKYGKYVVRESKAPTGYKLDVKNYSVNITENGMTYVISNIAGTELFGNEPQPCKIVLTKKIPLDEVNGKIWFEHGNPTFILKLVNTTPGENYNRTYYQAVEFTKEYVDNNTITVNGKKYVDMSVTFDELSAGTYTASEAIVGQRYKFNRLLNIKNGVANGKQCDFTLSPGQVGQATFYNVKRSFDTNTHNSLCVNVIKK